MRITLRGVRGSLPSPMGSDEYQQKLATIIATALEKSKKEDNFDIPAFIRTLPKNLKYNIGGNTTCVEVQSDSGKIYILDAGTGIRALGDELMATEFGKGQGEISLFFTHTHWDHIHGLPFFKPVYIPGNKVHFYSILDDLQERLAYQTDFRFFPAPFNDTASTKNFIKLEIDKSYELEPGLSVRTIPLKHPGGCVAYRFTNERGSFIFATDVEFTGDYLEDLNTSTDFFNDADLIVLDAQYTLDESFQKFDWGHTSFTMAVNCALKWRTRHMVLTHHEPAYSDETLMENYREAVKHRNSMGKSWPRLHIAREGARFKI